MERHDAASAEDIYAIVVSRAVDRGWLISRGHLLGLLAYTIGSLDQAVTHFEDAIASYRNGGHRPDVELI